MPKKIYLTLENGKVFEGYSFGADTQVVGEVVFTTSMVGYIETLTDKNYYGQLVVQTFPLIGNYGVISADFNNTDIIPKGYIVKEWCRTPSNFRMEGDIDTWLKEKGVTGIYGIDTRGLTRTIRDCGVMNGVISTEVYGEEAVKLAAQYKIENAVKAVTGDKVCAFTAENGKYNVAVLDCGMGEGFKNTLLDRGYNLKVFPATAKAEEILNSGPDGIIISGGPGNPALLTDVIEEIKKLSDKNIPIYGIGLGHQLLALASGFKVDKLKYGHRGGNQACQNKENGRNYTTSQNHGYAVAADSIDSNIASELFVNINDKTNEGIRYKNVPAFSTQFYPETGGGPSDSSYLYDDFSAMMGER